MKTRNVIYLFYLFTFLGVVLLVASIFSYTRLLGAYSLQFYYYCLLPRDLYLMTASELYFRGQFLTMVLSGLFILAIFPFISVMFISIFKSLSKNFEFFDEAWRTLKEFILECFKKKKRLLFTPSSYISMGFMFGLTIIWSNISWRTLFTFFPHYTSFYFLLPSPLLVPFNIIIVLMYYAQTSSMYTIVGILFIPLIVVFTIGWHYESTFRKEIKSLSPKKSISSP